MGRIRSPGKYIARPAWYDRTPRGRTQAYTGDDVAPHSSTVRWTYTVPAGKKALLEVGHVSVLRKTAASTVGKVEGLITVQPSGEASIKVLYALLLKNTVGDVDKVSVGQSLTLNAGDVLTAITQDLSTGGTCDYYISAKYTEFDA